MHSVLAFKLGVTKVVIRAVLNVGCKPRIDYKRSSGLHGNLDLDLVLEHCRATVGAM
jgi:hypothetical protein